MNTITTVEKNSYGEKPANICAIINCQSSNLKSSNLEDIFSAVPNLGLQYMFNNDLHNCRGTTFIPL